MSLFSLRGLPWEQMLDIRSKRHTTEVCPREIHAREVDSPLYVCRIRTLHEPEFIMLCSRCGRTPEEIIDAYLDAEAEAPDRTRRRQSRSEVTA